MPSLSAPFSLKDVQTEFHPNVRPNSMVPMAQRIFGTAQGMKLSDFDGFGSPIAVTATPDNITSNDADMRIDVLDWGGIDVSFWFEIWEANGTPTPNSGQTVITTDTGIATSNGLHSVKASSGGTALDDNTSYDFRVFYENEFIVNNPRTDNGNSSFSTPSAGPQTPSLAGSPDSHFITAIAVHLEWNADDTPDFDMNYRLQGDTTWITPSNNAGNKINWGTPSNPKEADWTLNQFFDPGDNVEFRLRANGNGTSSWSNIITLTV